MLSHLGHGSVEVGSKRNSNTCSGKSTVQELFLNKPEEEKTPQNWSNSVASDTCSGGKWLSCIEDDDSAESGAPTLTTSWEYPKQKLKPVTDLKLYQQRKK